MFEIDIEVASDGVPVFRLLDDDELVAEAPLGDVFEEFGVRAGLNSTPETVRDLYTLAHELARHSERLRSRAGSMEDAQFSLFQQGELDFGED